MKITMSFKEFNEKQDTKEIKLAELDVCTYNNKRYGIIAVIEENNVELTELPPLLVKEEE